MSPTLREFAESGDQPVRIACDTEFQGPLTLTCQFAARVGDDMAVQIYRAPEVPLPRERDVRRHLPGGLAGGWGRLLLRPPQPLDAGLSPVRVLADLFGLAGVRAVPRAAGEAPSQAARHGPPLTVELVAHFWRADFLRVFGADFFAGLLPLLRDGSLTVRDGRTLGYANGRGNPYQPPVLEYADDGAGLVPVRVKTLDTCTPFGPGGLGRLAEGFLGAGKAADFTDADKADMAATFRRSPAQAYAYAATDAALTLRLAEAMRATDRAMYEQLGFAPGEVPAMQPTLGRRVSELIVRDLARAARGSVALSRAGRPLAGGGAGKVSLAKVRGLLAGGGAASLAGGRASRFGAQTADTHGGLLFSRSPAAFFHAAPGQLRDVDLAGCYGAILGGMSLYAGRPVVYEPGAARMTVAEAVAFLERHAAGRDAWFLKASGPIRAGHNVLIPSTLDALTNANYASRAARCRSQRGREGRDAERGTALFSAEVQAGIVAWPTWLMIRAMPPALRAEYEALEVDSIVFYPARLVADTPEGYDELVGRLRAGGAPWSEVLDVDGLVRRAEERIGAEHAALRYDLGALMRRVSELRAEARRRHGRGSGPDLAWKLTVNSGYGVLACPHLPTGNVVAANVVTATARTRAFALQMPLNGLQVITDGTTYRRDRIPACTFAECLAAAPDYPLEHAAAGLPFLDPADVPVDDDAFTAWHRRHLRDFFEVDGPDYAALFDLHGLEHKEVGATRLTTFDAIGLDGSANNLKLVAGPGGLKVAEFKARSYRPEAKTALGPWLAGVYAADDYPGPPPVAESGDLLTFGDACRTARRATSDAEGSGLAARALVPLGFERRKAQAYKVIKPSAFVFQTPAQRDAAIKSVEKFEAKYACGLELLARRRSTRGRRRGSIADVAGCVHRLIREGCTNFTKALNLTREFEELRAVRAGHAAEVARRKQRLAHDLVVSLDERSLGAAARRTGLFVEPADAGWLGRAS